MANFDSSGTICPDYEDHIVVDIDLYKTELKLFLRIHEAEDIIARIEAELGDYYDSKVKMIEGKKSFDAETRFTEESEKEPF